MASFIQFTRRAMIACALSATAMGAFAAPAFAADDSFTIAVIPDTQNYMDYTHQKAEGFPFNANEQFFAQMAYIAANVESAGGDIAFVTSLGDVWQHQSLLIDPAHEKRGFKRAPNPVMDSHFAPTEKTRTIEMPAARKGFAMIAGKVPFSVVPGNHDYDAMWTDSNHPPKKEIKGTACFTRAGSAISNRCFPTPPISSRARAGTSTAMMMAPTARRSSPQADTASSTSGCSSMHPTPRSPGQPK